MNPAYADPTHYVAWYAADGRRVAWSDYASEADALAVFNGEDGQPLSTSVRIEMGSITDDGGFEPMFSRSLISTGFVDVSNITP